MYVEPTTVVEIACDGLQLSTRYPGGVALRFARVLRYRPDKTPAEEADTIDTVRATESGAAPALSRSPVPQPPTACPRGGVTGEFCIGAARELSVPA